MPTKNDSHKHCKTFVYTQNVAMEIGDHRAELSIRAGINLLLVYIRLTNR